VAPTVGTDKIYPLYAVYIPIMGKHLVDIDEQALRSARAEFGTKTIKDTVNQALRRAGSEHREDVRRRLDRLARANLAPRERAWR